jgi:hypothetical protein
VGGRIEIVTIAHDLHACIIADRLRKRHERDVRVVEVDTLSSRYRVSIDPGTKAAALSLRDEAGEGAFAPGCVVWWRRSKSRQALEQVYEKDAHVELINNDWAATLRGAVAVADGVSWVSPPDATERAGNKIHQLSKAVDLGLDIPNTRISNDAEAVRALMEGGRNVIVKPVVGVVDELLYTRRFRAEEIDDADAVQVCPAIYQECIEGTLHLRVNVFGESVYTAAIRTRDLDWRRVLPGEIEFTNDFPDVEDKCRRYVRSLGLAMGVIDMKVTPDDRCFFLEINPQGQFLFLEGMTGFPLADRFCEFLAAA